MNEVYKIYVTLNPLLLFHMKIKIGRRKIKWRTKDNSKIEMRKFIK